MKTQHTPGPWQLWRQGIEIHSDPEANLYGHEVAVVINNIPCSLCFVPMSQTASNHGEPGVLHISKEESLANAALIASAPELLEALREVTSELAAAFKWQLENNRISAVVAVQRQATLDKARSAMAKARGAR